MTVPFQSPDFASTVMCSGRMPMVLAVSPSLAAVDEIHLRRADEAGDEVVCRRVVEFHRRADLLDLAGVQHDDLVGERHRLDLVMRHIDHGRLQAAVQPRDLETRVDAQRRIEIGQRLVEQEELRFAHDGAADGDALALAAGQFGRDGARDRARATASTERLGDRGVDLVRWVRPPASGRGPYCPSPSGADRAHRTGTPWRCRAWPAACVNFLAVDHGRCRRSHPQDRR